MNFCACSSAMPRGCREFETGGLYEREFGGHPGGGRQTRQFAPLPGQVRLIGIAAFDGDLGKARACRTGQRGVGAIEADHPSRGFRTQAQLCAEALAEMPPAPAHVPSKLMDRDAAASPYQGVPGMATSGLGVQQRSDCAPRTRSSAANLDGQSGAPRTRHGQHGYRFSEADDQGHRTRREPPVGSARQPILPVADIAIDARRQRRRGSPEDHLGGADASTHIVARHDPEPRTTYRPNTASICRSTSAPIRNRGALMP